MNDITILDPCCGSKMFYFDKDNDAVLYGDKRCEKYVLCDGRALEIKPDIVLDFTSLPFSDDAFKIVVFDPPHLRWAGKKSYMLAKYGQLETEWREQLRLGFAECFRVLEPHGVLIFKWSEAQIKVKEILKLTPYKPLFGHPSGKRMDTHWITFIKPPK